MPNTTMKPSHDETPGAGPGPLFDRDEHVDELNQAVHNRNIGTELWFENERVQIWDLSLNPGERLPFHCHDEDYFAVVTNPGRLLQRYDDGTSRLLDTRLGQVNFLKYENGDCTVHDLENVGDTFFRCVTVIMKD